MKVSEIKRLVEEHDLETLKQLEDELTEEKPLSHEVNGKDEGDQLTNVLGAIWVKDQMEDNDWDLKTAIRQFSSRVRGSIS